MKWNVRAVDWVAGTAMSVVLVAGGSFALGAWGDLGSSTPATEGLEAGPSVGPSPSPAETGTPAESAARPRKDAEDDRATTRRLPATDGTQGKAGTDPTPSSVQAPAPERPQRAGAGSVLALSGDEEAPPAQLAEPVDVVISSFNVLGSSHTEGSRGRRGWGPGPTRARYAAQLLLAHKVDIVGFQEMQRNQMAVIQSMVGDRYALFPGAAMSERESVNSIAWDTTKWESVGSRTVSIPYFRGSLRRMPLVQLQSRDNGARIWVGNFHNPASPPGMGDNERWRARATQIEIGVANDLIRTDELPVVFTGDFNEREDVFCPMVAQTPLVASNGGSDDGVCRPPSAMNVDWVFGSDIEWLDHQTDRSSLVRRTTDHPMVVATGLLQPPGGSSAAAEAADAMARAQRAQAGD